MAKGILSQKMFLEFTKSFNLIFYKIGVPRPTITWFKDGSELFYHRFFQVKFLNSSIYYEYICRELTRIIFFKGS